MEPILLEQVIADLASDDAKRSVLARYALNLYGDAGLAPRLLEIIRAGRRAASYNATVVLSSVARDCAPELLAALQAPEAGVRVAAQCLRSSHNPAAVPPLARALADPDHNVRAAAAGALTVLGDARAAPALIRALNDRFKRVKESCAEALGKIGGRDSVDALIDVLGRGPTAPRASAAAALGHLRETRAVPALLDLLASDAISPTICAAIQALAEIGDRRALAAMDPWLQYPSPWLRDTTARAISRLQSPEQRRSSPGSGGSSRMAGREEELERRIAAQNQFAKMNEQIRQKADEYLASLRTSPC